MNTTLLTLQRTTAFLSSLSTTLNHSQLPPGTRRDSAGISLQQSEEINWVSRWFNSFLIFVGSQKVLNFIAPVLFCSLYTEKILRKILYNNIAIIAIQHSKINFLYTCMQNPRLCTVYRQRKWPLLAPVRKIMALGRKKMALRCKIVALGWNVF